MGKKSKITQWKEIFSFEGKKMNQQKEIDEIVKEIVKSYQPEKIVLFGFETQAGPDKNSGVNLLVITPPDKISSKQEIDIEKTFQKKTKINVIFRSVDELERRRGLKDPFYNNILEKGKVVYLKGAHL